MDYDALLSLSTYAQGQTVSLNGVSLTLLFMLTEIANTTTWKASGEPLTDAQKDNLDAIISQAFLELETEGKGVIGTIFAMATASAPAGALLCDGSTHLRTDYPALYALLDSAFIVDADHFITPDMRSRVPIGSGSGSGLSTYAPGATGGQESHALTLAELASHAHSVTDPGHVHTITDPQHNHGLNDIGHVHTITDPGHNHSINVVSSPAGIFQSGTNRGGGVSANTNNNTTGITGTNNSATGISVLNGSTGISVDSHSTGITAVNSAGSGAAHENRQPYLALKYAIWAE